MFPIGDDDTSLRTTPIVTYGLIAANVLFFLVELNGGDRFIQDWAFIPSRFTHDPTGNMPTLFTAMFMHGGWMHLFSTSSATTSKTASAISDSSRSTLCAG